MTAGYVPLSIPEILSIRENEISSRWAKGGVQRRSIPERIRPE